jgi:hypothetical protein
MQSLSQIQPDDRAGNCYLLSLVVVLYEPGGDGFVLCHGRIDGILKHSWVDTGDGNIFDPVLDRTMSADSYLEHAVVERKYTRRQARQNVNKFSTCGPWQ